MNYRPLLVAVGLIGAARMAQLWRAARAEKAREQSNMNTWEAEGGSLVPGGKQ